MAKTHKIKILPRYFSAVFNKIKNAEVRYNDRGYEVGDWLLLEEWADGHYTGLYVYRWIKAVYELDSIGLNGYVLICME